MTKKQKTIPETLWQTCDKLSCSVEPSEYKYDLLGLIFLKFTINKFEQCKSELIAEVDKTSFVHIIREHLDNSKISISIREVDLYGRAFKKIIKKIESICLEIKFLSKLQTLLLGKMFKVVVNEE